MTNGKTSRWLGWRPRGRGVPKRKGAGGAFLSFFPLPRPSSLTARHPALSSVWEAHSSPAPEAGDGERKEEPDGKGLGSEQLEPDATVTWRSIEVSASEPETVSATRAASASLTTFTPETITRGGQRGKGREGRGRLRDSVLALRSVLAQEVLAPVARGGVPI